jgi:microcystin-dependent protein
MATPFLGEIKLFSINFPPKGWALCNGQLLPIGQNQPLFALLGTTYGGNGQNNFALPNLQGRVPIHFSNAHVLGEAGGSTAVTLTMGQLPAHTHLPSAKNTIGDSNLPAGKVLAQTVAVQQDQSSVAVNMYSNNGSFGKTLNPGAIGSTGGSQPHNNMMPYLTLNFCIALQGIFPSRN